ncbi:MAG: class I SAM-dependent methyltransferase [Promethearchaeia archaeon]
MNENKKIYYNQFAKDYHLKRKQPWTTFLNFIENIIGKGLFQSIIRGISVDLGCANGRHFKVINTNQNHLLGIDSSFKFLTIAKRTQLDNDIRTIHLCCADMKRLPLRERSVDCFISIAALHHIKTKRKRKEVMRSLSNILKKEGNLFFSVWRRWQKKFFKDFFIDKLKRLFLPSYRKNQRKLGLKEFGDIFVPWTVSQTKETYHRFYHLFSKQEAIELCKIFEIREFEAMGGPTDRDNFFFLCQKLD